MKTFRLMDEQLIKTMAMVAGGLLAGVAITKATSALSDVSILYHIFTSVICRNVC